MRRAIFMNGFCFRDLSLIVCFEMEGLIFILYTSKRFETVRCSLPRGVLIARPLSTIITLLTHIKQFH